MAKFAEGTSVPVAKSQQEIGATLAKYGATKYATAWEDGRAMIAFGIENRHVRMVLALAAATDPDIARTPGGRVRDQAAREAAADAENRAAGWTGHIGCPPLTSAELELEAALAAVADLPPTFSRRHAA